MSSLQPDASFSGPTPPRHSARRIVTQFGLWALAGVPLVAWAALLLTRQPTAGLALALGGYGVGVVLALGLFRRGFAHPTLGACNVVTLLRLVLAAVLLAPLADQAGPWPVFAIAALAFALDGVDGWLARRGGRVSEFGARFDMEVDSALALILALNAFVAGTAGWVVVLIGLPRYAFAAAGVALPWLGGPLPARFSRKAVCVVQVAALIALQLPVLPPALAEPLVVAVAIALLWSFWRDVTWLWRHRT